MEIKRKVLAYITRGEEPNWEILVFEHKDHPEAGIQVPAGTIEDGELIVDALYREIIEETGIQREDLVLKKEVSKTNYYPKNKNTLHERTIFHLTYIGPDRDEWKHCVDGDGEDQGLIFLLHFLPVNGLPKLAAEQDQAIDLL